MPTAARQQLDLVLSFFPRVEGRLSLLLSINLGMLALLSVNAPPLRDWQVAFVFVAIPVLLIGVSLSHIYQGFFPQLDGGKDSLIYFREIAARTESKFIEDFKTQGDQAYVNDILGQVWRNSEILKEKFDHLRSAFTLLAWAILPWIVSLGLFAATKSDATHLLAK